MEKKWREKNIEKSCHRVKRDRWGGDGEIDGIGSDKGKDGNGEGIGEMERYGGKWERLR